MFIILLYRIGALDIDKSVVVLGILQTQKNKTLHLVHFIYPELYFFETFWDIKLFLGIFQKHIIILFSKCNMYVPYCAAL